MAVKNPTQLDFVLVNGDFEVHKHNCADVKRAIKNKVTDYAEPGIINVDPTDDFNDVVRFLWDDQIAESYDPTEDPDPDNAVVIPAQDATDDTEATPETTLPSPAWLAEHGYLSATHFNPCIKQWVNVKTEACTGQGKEWKGLPDTRPAALECPECGITAGELGLTPRKKNGKYRPLVPQHQSEVEELLTPSQTPAKTTATGNGKAEAKRLLATLVAQAIADMAAKLADTNMADTTDETADYRFVNSHFTQDEILKIASTWVHHIPADRERWVAMGLPKPDRSDWR